MQRAAAWMVLAIAATAMSAVLAGDPATLDAPKFTFKIHADRVDDAWWQVMEQTRLPMGIQEARWFDRPGDTAETTAQLQARRKAGIDIEASNATMRNLLDAFVARYPEYEWSFDDMAGVVNLRPRQSPLVWSISPGSEKAMPLDHLFVSEKAGFISHGVMFWPTRGGKGVFLTVAMPPRPVTSEFLLNDICRQLRGDKRNLKCCFGWSLREYEEPSATWDQPPRPIDRMVYIKRQMEPEDPFQDSNVMRQYKLPLNELQRIFSGDLKAYDVVSRLAMLHYLYVPSQAGWGKAELDAWRTTRTVLASAYVRSWIEASRDDEGRRQIASFPCLLNDAPRDLRRFLTEAYSVPPLATEELQRLLGTESVDAKMAAEVLLAVRTAVQAGMTPPATGNPTGTGTPPPNAGPSQKAAPPKP